MKLFRIKHRFTRKIIFELETQTLKLCVEGAVKRRVDLWGADLWGVDLGGANLRRADLGGADLGGANLRGANLWGADLGGADLRGANLRRADLGAANLLGADLLGADLWGANLWGVDHISTRYIATQSICPRSGSFIAWKKGHDDHIIKLKIPAWARRVSPIVGRKCRAEFAIVLAVYNTDGASVNKCGGWKNSGFIYKVGKIVKPDSYDANPLIECSHGIHFFVTKQEAEEWK